MTEPENLKKSFEMKKIGVLMGGISAEREVSLKTGPSILEAMLRKGYIAVAIDVDFIQKLSEAEKYLQEILRTMDLSLFMSAGNVLKYGENEMHWL